MTMNKQKTILISILVVAMVSAGLASMVTVGALVVSPNPDDSGVKLTLQPKYLQQWRSPCWIPPRPTPFSEIVTINIHQYDPDILTICNWPHISTRLSFVPDTAIVSPDPSITAWWSTATVHHLNALNEDITITPCSMELHYKYINVTGVNLTWPNYSIHHLNSII